MKLHRLAPVFMVLLATAPLQAQEETPNHVFQSAEMIHQELLLLNEANFSEAPTQQLPRIQALPRHVFQRARIIWAKVQLLRFMNGLPTRSIDPLPVRDVQPADVKGIVDSILADIRALRPAYSVTQDVAETALPQGKTPTDVLAHLAMIDREIDALGVPGIVPNDVYQVAATLVRDLETVTEQMNVTVDLNAIEPALGKSPTDAYNNAYALLADLQALSTTDQRFSVTGGIEPPQQKNSDITPSDVILLLGRGLADVGAVKYATGVTTATVDMPLEGGKTPSDVFHVIEQARDLVAALSASNNG